MSNWEDFGGEIGAMNRRVEDHVKSVIDSVNDFFRDCGAHQDLINLGWDPAPFWRRLECPTGSHVQYESKRRLVRKKQRIMYLEITNKGEERFTCAYPSGSACPVFPDEMEIAIKLLHFMKEKHLKQ